MSRVLAIDLSDFRASDPQRHARFVERLREGMLDVGFVRVIGHGIAPALCHRVHAEFEAFFAQDEVVKRRCGGISGGQRGFTPIGVEHARDHAVADLKEFFHVGQEDLSHVGPGVYPPNVWSSEQPALREASLALFRALEACSRRLLEAIAEGFDLRSDRLAGLLDGGNSILRALHYPPVPDDADPHALRAAPHEDINLITLLCEATDTGLEILSRGEWTPVESKPGEIVADAGDMLSRLTNGRIPSTTHRVVADAATAARHRYALPFFAHPRPDCALDVIPTFVAPGEKPRFAPITAEAFLAERLAEIGLAPAD